MKRYKVTFTATDVTITPVPKSETYFHDIMVQKSHLGLWLAMAVVEAPNKTTAHGVARQALMDIAPNVMWNLLSGGGIAAP